MSINEYDETLQDLAQGSEPLPKAPAPNPYDQTVEQLDQARETQLRKTIIDGSVTAPDRAAQVQKLSQRTGLPAPIVDRNFEDIRKRAAIADTPYTEMLRDSPVLSDWLVKKPDLAPVAHDDLEQLGFLEWLTKAPRRAWDQGTAQVRYGMLRNQELYRELTPAEREQLASDKAAMEAGGKLGAGSSWFRGAITGSAQNLPNMIGAWVWGLQRGIPAGVAAGTAAAAVDWVGGGPVGEVVGTPTAFAGGMAAGMYTGAGDFTARMESGLAYDEYLAFRDEFGQPLDRNVAKAAALATGYANGALEAVGLEFLFKSIPGLDKLASLGSRSAVKQALRQPTVRAALLHAVKSYGETLTAESSVEVAQRAVTILSGELAKMTGKTETPTGQTAPGNTNLYQQPTVQNADGSVSTVDSVSINVDGKEVLIPRVTPDGRHLTTEEATAEYRRTGRNLGTFDSPASANAFAEQLHNDYAAGTYDKPGPMRTPSDVLGDLVSEGLGAVQSFALTVAPGPIGEFSRHVAQARSAQANVRFFQALGEGVAQSKTGQRLPEALQSFVEDATKDGPVANVYADVDTWTNYWQSKGVDPAAVATEVTGSRDAYDHAVNTGEHLEIPTARYAVKLAATEHNAFWANELRLGPDQMNGREAGVFEQQIAQLAQAQSEPSAAANVKQQIVQQLVAAGYEPGTADSYATLYESAFGAMAERAGLDPADVFAQYGLKVQRGEQQAPAERKVEPATAALPLEPAAPTTNEEGQIQTPADAVAESPAGREPAPQGESGGTPPADTAQAGAEGGQGAAAASTTPPPALTLPATPHDVARAVAAALGSLQPTTEEATLAGSGSQVQDPGSIGNEGDAAGNAGTPNSASGRSSAPGRGEQLPGGAPERRSPGQVGSGLAGRAPGRAGEGRTVQLPAGYEPRFAALRDGAHQLGYAGDDDSLAQLFRDRLDQARSIARDLASLDDDETTGSTLDLLKTIAAAGGIGIEAEAGSSEYSTRRKGKVLGNGGATGELENMLESLARSGKSKRTGKAMPRQFMRSGGLPGVPGIIVRKGGLTADRMREHVQQDPRWQHLENLSDFLSAVDDAIRIETGTSERPGASTYSIDGILSSLLEVRPDTAWWSAPAVENNGSGESAASLEAINREASMKARGERFVVYDQAGNRRVLIGVDAVDYVAQPGETYGVEGPHGFQLLDDRGGKAPAASVTNLLHEDAILNGDMQGPDAGDVTFDISEFDQGLFDALNENPEADVDVLATGEKQPRLPGAEHVRDQEVQQQPIADLKDEFRLTAPEETQATQTTLFQGAYHGTRHEFEEFSLQHIGSGEGNQSYGWGLYFASQRDIAEQYRRSLAGPAKEKRLTVGGDDVFDGPGQSGRSGGLYQRQLDTRDGRIRLDHLSAADRDKVQKEAARVAHGLMELHGRAYYSQVGDAGIETIRTNLERSIANIEELNARGNTMSGDLSRDAFDLERYKDALYVLDKYKGDITIAPPSKPGRTFTVEIPEDDEYLDWDKTASQQSPKVQAALEKLGIKWKALRLKTAREMRVWLAGPTAQRLAYEDIGMREAIREAYLIAANATVPRPAALNDWQAKHQGLLNSGVVDMTGESIYQELQQKALEQGREQFRQQYGFESSYLKSMTLKESAAAASRMLNEQGVAGIRYLDGQSRRNGEGSHNYVVFDDKLVQVKEFDQAAKPMTDADLENWAEALKARTGPDLVDLELSNRFDGGIEIAQLGVRRGGTRAGVGTAVMHEIIRLADAQRRPLVLRIAESGYSTDGGSAPTESAGALLRFYGRFGFTVRETDENGLTVLEREPSIKAGKTGLQLEQPFFHGSPHDFDRFSTENIGTGQGAHTYGWGLYFAENPSVASTYHEQLAGGGELQELRLGSLVANQANGFNYSRRASESTIENIRASLAEDLIIDEGALHAVAKNPLVQVLKALDAKLADYRQQEPPYEEGVKAGEQLRRELSRPGAVSVKFGEAPGGVYQVEIADEHVAKMLDWDAPINKQPKPVQAMVRAKLKELHYLRAGDDGPRQLTSAFKAFANEHGGMLDGPTGGFAHQILYEAKLAELTAPINKKIEALEAASHDKTQTPAWKTKEAFEQWMHLVNERAKLETQASKALSLELLAKGVPGIKYFDQGSRNDKSGTRNVVAFDDSIVQLTHKNGTPVSKTEKASYLKTLKQETKGGSGDPQRRGFIRFGPDRQFNIALLERADLSTFLHETGHFYLEVFSDLADQVRTLPEAARTATQQQLVNDHADLLAWLGVDNRNAINEAAHEKFARGFEAYLMEGHAPSLELRNAFARFRAWLVAIYKSLKSLHVGLTDDVRRVLDRMVATDKAIFAAEQEGHVEPMFTTAAAAGMTDTRFGLYRAAIAEASRAQREKLERRVLAEVTREQQTEWKRRRAEIRGQVEREVFDRQVYQALAAMQHGTRPDGTPLLEETTTEPVKLSRAKLVELFGADRLKRLPKPSIYTSINGADPEVVARMFGYSSADELLSAVERAAPAKAVIEHETTQRMLAEHGSILLDGSLHDRAREAVATEEREAVIRAELRALANLRTIAAPFIKAGDERVKAEREERAYERRWMDAERKLEVAIAKKEAKEQIDALRDEVKSLRARARGGAATIRAAIPPAGVLAEQARQRLAAMRVRDLAPARYWAASRQAAQRAIETAARQDFSGAIIAKQQELINLHLYRQASDLRDAIEQRVKKIREQSTRAGLARLGLAGDGYLEQYQGILERFSFTPASQPQLDRRTSLREWVNQREEAGLPVELPEDVLDEVRRTPYQNLSTEEFMGVADALDNIAHIAQLERRRLKAAADADFFEARDQVVESIGNNNKQRPTRLEFTAKDERARSVADWFASHSKLSFLARALDGYQDGGALWDAIVRPLNAAADDEFARNEAAGKTYGDIVRQAYGHENLSAKLFIPAIGNSLSHEARLAVALQWGNENGRERLTNDPIRKWNRDQVLAILDTLDKRDWDFVQNTWNYLDTFWPAIAEKQKRVTGLEPEKVDALPIETKFGEYKGGYYPLAYDGRMVPRAEQAKAASEAKLAASAAYVRTTTRRGHTETRKRTVRLPVRLDLGVAFEHINQVIHDLTHHEALIDVTRMLRDGKVSQAIVEHAGDVVYQQFTKAVQDIALGYIPGRGILDKAATFMRTGTQLSLLGWNLWTSAQQPLGIFNGAAEVGTKWVARGLKRWLRDAASMENTLTWISEVSPFMRSRTANATQDLNDLRTRLHQPGGWFDRLVRTVTLDAIGKENVVNSYLWHIGVMQRVADVPTWLGAYEKAMATEGAGDEARAIALADQAVRNAQGGGSMVDLAQVQRGSPIARAFMTFYSYGNVVFNQTKDAIGRTSFRSPAQVAGLLGNLSLIYFMPALATVTLGHVTGKMTGEEPEDWLVDLARELLGTALNEMVLVRELTGLVEPNIRGYAGPAGARTFELFYRATQQMEQGKIDEGLVKALNQLAGTLLRYPALQVQRTADGLAALEEGRSSNPFVLLFGAPPKNEKR